MAIVASVRALDGMQAEEAGRADAPSPGVNREASAVIAYCSVLRLGSIWEDRRRKPGFLGSKRALKTQRHLL